MTAPHYETLADGRKHIKELLDAAEAGRPASVRRDNRQTAVVDADRLRHALSLLRPAHAQVVPESDGWSILIPGLPLAADGDTVDDALTEMVASLREYAHDWSDHLLHAPNHADNWALVQLIDLSTDSQLKDWLVQ